MTVSEKVESQSKIPSVKRPWNPTLEKTKGGVPGIRSLRNQFKKAHARALIARVIQEEFMKSTMQACMFLLMVMLALGLSACGSPATYTISGTVTNFTSAAVPLQLQNNGANTLSVTANGSFTFRSALRRGSTYNVTISVQPSSPVQTCGVTHGNGTVTGNVTDVAVDCGHNEWSWMGGSNLSNQPGTYGTQGTPAPGNIPGPRTVAGTSMDATGNVWLFGGFGGDSTGAWGSLDDLWKYSGGEWTWISARILAIRRERGEPKGRLRRTTFQRRESGPLHGLTRPEISGSSVDRAMIRRGQVDGSTTCGSTVEASGHG